VHSFFYFIIYNKLNKYYFFYITSLAILVKSGKFIESFFEIGPKIRLAIGKMVLPCLLIKLTAFS